ncbi:glycoside hydrolase family 31 protein [Cohnella sp. JJ-181]|uniref:glycoside hydrolase family 31 protein n=1 Tax=Cohnella rhizoplanae TaxID=2974897 RepID=UPI0022FF6564|nr:TIM-barrel domain-containing protein [Cohnella sp. JJ-181]CAI6077611.1 Oligosaccharide 4-alpha-D-glucosyltransferase [Cohnella sp. JJ-181]
MQTSETIHPDKIEHDDKPKIDWHIGAIQSVLSEQGVYVFRGEHASIMLQPVNDHIVRVKLLLDHALDVKSTIAVQMEAYTAVDARLEEELQLYKLVLPTLAVVVHKRDARIDFYNADGELISREIDLYREGRGVYGIRKAMETDSHIYGLGEKTSFLDKKGEKYDMWNSDVYDPHVPEIECLYVSIPFLVHFRYDRPAYGIFLDNPGRSSFDMRSSETSYKIQVNSGKIDYYFVYGPQLKDVVQRYSGLTGRMELPPAWAIGYHQSRYSYMDQEEVMKLARNFRSKNIPCDVIYLDIHYMDEYRVFTFDPVRFPNPKQMIDELGEMGIKIVPIVDPGVKKDPEYAPYREGTKNDYFCRKLEGEVFIGNVWPGASAFPDFTEAQVRDWWGEQHRYYTDLGIHGIWNDMNEPAVFNASKTMDLDVVHGNDGDMKTHRELHNLYGMLMSMATQQGLKKQLDGERPFVLTRAGYAGVQKYAATWTGDNRSFWEHLAMAIPMVLNLGLSGQPFSGPDIGGFAHNASPELLARWTQAGVFFPYCRNHSVLESIRQEPWSFGPQIEDICRKFIRLRYKLLPYLYTQFHEAHKTGLPIMRPLILEYPDDRSAFNLCDQFLVGTSLLVAPILRPGTEFRSVYLPAGEWIDYWTGERHAGGRTILAHAPMDVLPLYAKAGSLLPELAEEEWKPVMNEQADVTLSVYAGAPGTGSDGQWYEDDARTYDYEKGVYNLLQSTAVFHEDKVSLKLAYLTKGMNGERKRLQIQLKAMNFAPKSISAGSVGLEEAGGSWSYDEALQVLSLQVPNTFEEMEFVIQG